MTVDVAETLIAEADALGPDLVFDANGKRVRAVKTAAAASTPETNDEGVSSESRASDE